MRFEETVRYLLSLGVETLTIKLGLRNTELLLSELGNPQKFFPSVQIAGTNGKGSTAVVLDSICRAAGLKAGLYTSPHLISITERIKLDGQEISKERFSHYATEVRGAAEKLIADGQFEALPTFFEQVTAIALLAFREDQVQLAILETGLGGRLDATSVASAQVVAITPIAKDHEEYLGETLESIAAEKAAIIRPGVTAIVAPQTPEAMNVILRQCERVKVKPILELCNATVQSVTPQGRLRASFKTNLDLYEDVLVGLNGRHQITNVSVAIRVAESLRSAGFDISHSAIVKGIETARHPGRLEIWQGCPATLFDGAHNPSGASVLRQYLEEFVAMPVTMVFGAMRDKDLEQMASILFPFARLLVLTKLDSVRSASVAELEKVAFPIVEPEKVISTVSVADAIRKAMEITPPNGLICFCGSLYLIGEAQALISKSSAAEVHS
jgi:dihydrofolate synthase/folylpolyglutamate synthase